MAERESRGRQRDACICNIHLLRAPIKTYVIIQLFSRAMEDIRKKQRNEKHGTTDKDPKDPWRTYVVELEEERDKLQKKLIISENKNRILKFDLQKMSPGSSTAKSLQEQLAVLNNMKKL